jgi:hypothetical protein
MQTTIGKYRWKILSLIFFATTVNYLDRAVISLLKPYLESYTGSRQLFQYRNLLQNLLCPRNVLCGRDCG